MRLVRNQNSCSPQGSILDPILFLIYINDLIDQVDSEIRVFADETFIFKIAGADSTSDLNEDLAKITAWATQWKMRVQSGDSQASH